MEAAEISGKERKSGTGTLAGDFAEDKICRRRHQLPNRRREAKPSTGGGKMPRRGKPKQEETLVECLVLHLKTKRISVAKPREKTERQPNRG
jgi:hypothetical protein